MANLIHRMFGSAESKKPIAPSSGDTATTKPSSTIDLAAKHDAMMSASSANMSKPTPQKSLNRKHATITDLYGKVVQIEVGNDEDSTSPPRTFEIHEGLLCKHSGYFKRELGDITEQSERKQFQFFDHDAEIFQYVTLWLYEGVLYRAKPTRSEDNGESPAKEVKVDVNVPRSTHGEKRSKILSDRELDSDSDNEPPQKKAKRDIRYEESTSAEKGSDVSAGSEIENDQRSVHHNGPFNSDLTLFGDELATPIVLDDDDDAEIPLGSTQYFDTMKISDLGYPDSPPVLGTELKQTTEPSQTPKMVITDTQVLPLPPSIPLDTLTLTKLYILAQALELPALCNHVMLLISQRLSHDKEILIQALIYAFERSKCESFIRSVLIDYTARFADFDDVFCNAKAGALSNELLVDLLIEMGELRDGKRVGKWDEVGDVGMYMLPVRRL